MSDRRHAWATLEDAEIRRDLVDIVEKGSEWESRLDSLETNFSLLLAKLDGAVRASRVLLAVIAVLGSLLFGLALWYIMQRDSELFRFTAVVGELTTAVRVLDGTVTRVVREQDRQRDRLDEVRR